uniref:Peptidase S1 domain-containing protein n=1 Tax=Amphilophus citrinellus TaxID=61819 RepID=A0A3Q0TCD6_AMPCI
VGGLFVIKLLSFSGITVCTGIDLHKRIYGGHKCPKGDHLYYVKVIVENQTHETYCGGSLIHPQWVLTAAHCWKPGCQGQKVKVTSEKFYQDSNGRHDIMLLKLSTPANIQPVALPDFTGEPSDLLCANMHVVDCSPTLPATYTINACHLCSYEIFWNKLITDNIFLSQGDSGGGVIYNNMIYGVHSGTGVNVCTKPTISANVCSYLLWINQTIGPNSGK